jgi:Spy/CpxP family protein refolding chaperone
MNEQPRNRNKKALFLGAAVAVTLTGASWVWAADPDASTPATPAPHATKGEHHGKGGPGAGPGKMGKRDGRGACEGGRGGMLFHELNLTADQKAKVKAIMESEKPKIQAIREETRTKMQAVMEDVQAQIRPILTKEQQQVLDDAKKLREDKSALKAAATPTPAGQ